jgi:antitoxin MazE
MKTRVKKWGNGLGVRIPKSFAAEMGIALDSPVELSLVDGTLLIRPVRKASPPLRELLRGITKQTATARWIGDPRLVAKTRVDR